MVDDGVAPDGDALAVVGGAEVVADGGEDVGDDGKPLPWPVPMTEDVHATRAVTASGTSAVTTTVRSVIARPSVSDLGSA